MGTAETKKAGASNTGLQSGDTNFGGKRPEQANKTGNESQSAIYPDHPGWKGSADTGRQAAEALAPKLGRRQQEVLDAVAAHGPMCPEQIAARIGRHFVVTRPRASELKLKGLLTDTGDRAVGALGGKVQILRLTTPQERSDFAARRAAEDEKGPANG